MAGPIARLYATLGLDAREFTKGVDTAQSKAKGFGQLAKTGFGIGAGISVFGLATSAIGGVVNALGDAVSAAIEEEASIKALTTAIEANDGAWDGNMDAIEEVIEGRQRLAFSDDEQRDSLRGLVAITGDHTKALDLNRQAMDLARLKGISLADASTTLGKVYAGNFVGLRKMGIVLGANATATDYLAEVQRRAAGQAEAYAETTAGSAEAARIEMENLSEEIGAKLIPLQRTWNELLIKGLDTVNTLAGGASTDFITTAEDVEAINDALADMQGIFESLGQGGTGGFEAMSRLREIMGSDFPSGPVDQLHALEDALAAGIFDSYADDAGKAAAATRFWDLQLERIGKSVVEVADETQVTVGAFEGLSFAMVDTAKATGVAIDGWKEARKELGGLIRRAREMGDENDHTGKRLRQLVSQEKRLRAEQARAAEEGHARQVAALQLAIDKNNVMQSELRSTLDLTRLLRDVGTIRLTLTSNLAAFTSQLAGLVGGVVADADTGGGGGGRRRRRKRAAGGPVTSGMGYLVGERGPEMFVPDVSGRVIDHATTQGMAAGSSTTYNLTVNGSPNTPATPMEIVRHLRRAARMGFIDGRQKGWAG